MSKIEWTNETWNPIIGCSKVSEGCKNCYAEKMAGRLSNIPSTHQNYKEVVRWGQSVKTDMYYGLQKWNGKTHLIESVLEKPFHWRKPRMIFVCSMGDLFHESVPFWWIDKVFAVILANPHHTFQILTKRPERMLEWFNYKNTSWKNEGMQGPERIRYQAYAQFGAKVEYDNGDYWPLKNLWIGVSAENQEQANKRIPVLNAIPAQVKFVCLEPLLSRIDLNKSLGHTLKHHAGGLKNCLSWVIVGGESGPKARPMHPDWVRSIRDQCKDAEVPFFFKQWGEWRESVNQDFGRYHKWQWITPSGITDDCMGRNLINNHEWNTKLMFRSGKKKAGNLLDGKTYQEFPTSNNNHQTSNN